MEKKAVIRIEGMTCDHCRNFVTKAIKAVGGVKDVNVDLAAGKAEVVFDDSITGEAAIAAAVNETGVYKASV